jgi:predicted phage-related endonuclease
MLAPTPKSAPRTHGIGGTDWAQVYSLPPYGCAKRRKLELLGKIDSVDRETGPTARGRALEPLVADLYVQVTGYSIRRPTDEDRVDGLPPWMRGSLDYVAALPDGTQRVLDCKTAGEHVLRKMRESAPPDYWAYQAQHYMAITGLQHADYFVLWADGWEYELYTYERDEELIQRMLRDGEDFWALTSTPPKPHLRRMSVCSDCPLDDECHGLQVQETDDTPVIDSPELIGLAEEFVACRAEREALDDRIEELMQRLVEETGRHSAAHIGHHYTLRIRETTRTKVDAKKLAAQYPDVYAALTTTKKSHTRTLERRKGL